MCEYGDVRVIGYVRVVSLSVPTVLFLAKYRYRYRRCF